MLNTVLSLQEQKNKQQKITMLTAYDFTTARLFDEAGINMLLVGDSLGMVMLGHEDTLSVTMADMLHHTKAVSRAAKSAFVVADLPFLSYHISTEAAVINAGRLIQEGGANAVKLEGGKAFSDVITAITRAAIPVVAHLGLTPQSVNAFGGFKVQGRTETAARQVIKDALAVQNAGAFAVVLEGIPSLLGEFISQLLHIPTIGIGAGNATDGQVLVYQDMLGMIDTLQPKFVRRFAEGSTLFKDAVSSYQKDVQSGDFPNETESYKIDSDIIQKLKQEFSTTSSRQGEKS
ncbi:MAG: 3-methyl-2-oxobutanoate hydroxymethyltransferase [Lactococcus chungangensis]|uniref:3-methyl-2-oxobutanoate hydroxymethyltransferase n=1 Tax=Pseudolactococcus chungangensis CAU 28 = DSM 22330 TaxID=1122154 RepID=A0A1K2H5F8_9LACT|nr:3-methyl-2-oxobutanoate hydroxymethyltransferase [Lactococcus chungangensis]MDD3016117.1 3-methyl-2-oxobutanoate hydroxymethyltransferase [Lactococcus chungangensis]NCB80871.1 3-methyl-2-oxobutanoate hydroxymethyltransferase [Bacilli bacterium]PCS04536.1 3-methyl-2-oxobutanoate hydroxymethyltransferase [Lactococcus chungangensis CAU 28 = DSM 22330]SFZ71430.1 3-methyl-2-oxobutanoate hydroxymethyltransferase [Lactococcus chungangensis CAU 28 = DSM 22330]